MSTRSSTVDDDRPLTRPRLHRLRAHYRGVLMSSPLRSSRVGFGVVAEVLEADGAATAAARARQPRIHRPRRMSSPATSASTSNTTPSATSASGNPEVGRSSPTNTPGPVTATDPLCRGDGDAAPVAVTVAVGEPDSVAPPKGPPPPPGFDDPPEFPPLVT